MLGATWPTRTCHAMCAFLTDFSLSARLIIDSVTTQVKKATRVSFYDVIECRIPLSHIIAQGKVRKAP